MKIKLPVVTLMACFLSFLAVLPASAQAPASTGMRLAAINLDSQDVQFKLEAQSLVWESGMLGSFGASPISALMPQADFLVWYRSGTSPWQLVRNSEGKRIRYKADTNALHVVVKEAGRVQVRSLALPSGSGPAIAAVNGGTVALSIQVGSGWNQDTRLNQVGLGPGEHGLFAQFSRPFEASVWWAGSIMPAGVNAWSLNDADGKPRNHSFQDRRMYVIVAGLPTVPGISAQGGRLIDLGAY